MNEFKNKLVNLRNKARNAAKGTWKNIKEGASGENFKKMDDYKRSRNEGMMTENGMAENGSFAERLQKVRGKKY